MGIVCIKHQMFVLSATVTSDILLCSNGNSSFKKAFKHV